MTKRPTLWVVALFVLAAEGIARLPAVQRVFDPGDSSVYAARWRYVYSPSVPDVLLVGDSRTEMDLSPKVLSRAAAGQGEKGPFVLNVAIAGASMETDYLMLSQVVLQHGRPELILLNLSEVALNDAPWTDDAAAAYLQALVSPFSSDLWSNEAHRTGFLEAHSGLIRLGHRLRLTIEGRWPNYLRGRETYDWGGLRWYGKMTASLLDAQHHFEHDKLLADYRPDGKQGAALRKLLALAQTENLHLVLVITPVHPDFLKCFPQVEDAERFKQFVFTVAAEYKVPIVDYYQLPDLADADFFDLHHTNSQGTDAFSGIVAEDIVAPGLGNWAQFTSARQAPAEFTSTCNSLWDNCHDPLR